MNEYITQSKPTSTPTPTQSPQLKQAIAEQSKSDSEYTNWELNVRKNYPWMKKLPLHTQKYYVYFDLDKKVFIGLLYPQSGDNVEQMKTDILQHQLKEIKGIPVESYQFQWTINPK